MSFDPKSGGNVFQTTGTPSATTGANGDYAIDTTTAGGPFIYGPKANGTWPSAMGLGGATGTPGNLYAIFAKSASYASVSNDLSGPTPAYVYTCTGGSLTHTQDATLLWNSSTGQSKVVVLVRTDVTPANTFTIAGASGQTVNGSATYVAPTNNQIARRLFAISPTAMVIE